MEQLNLPIPRQVDVKLPDSWRSFRQEWEDYEIASNLRSKTQEVRIATLRIVMGRECVNILDNLGLKDGNKIEKILEALSAHFEPEINVIYQRSQFYSLIQRETESVGEYVNKLRHLASTCDFTPSRVHEEAIRDRLVLGLLDKQVTKKLLTNRKLTLCEAIATAKSSEQVNAEMNLLNAEVPVNYATTQVNRKDGKEWGKCKFCGKHHEWSKLKCPAFGATCKKCNGRNHFAIRCFQKQKDVHGVAETNQEEETREQL